MKSLVPTKNKITSVNETYTKLEEKNSEHYLIYNLIETYF